MEKIGINDKTDFYDNARSSRNEKAQRRVGSVGKDDIDASGWAEPTMETERKIGGRPVPRAFKRGGKVDGQEGKKHAGRKPRASGGKLLKYIGAASKDAARHAGSAQAAGNQTWIGKEHSKEGMKRSKGINLALDKLEGKAKVPARASGGKIHPKDCSCKMCSGGMANADGGKANLSTGMRAMSGSEMDKEYARDSSPKYNFSAVDKAIKSSRQKIGRKEAKLIHALLKGRTGRKVGGSANYEGGTRPDGGRIAKASGGHTSDKPLAAKGLISYRAKNGAYGHVMIGAKNHDDALRQAKRSNNGLEAKDLEIWNGKKYEPIGERSGRKSGGKVKGKTNINININTAPKPAMPMNVPPPAGAMPPPMMPRPMPPAGAMPPMAGGLPPGLGVPPPAMGAGPLPRASGGKVGFASGGKLLKYVKGSFLDKAKHDKVKDSIFHPSIDAQVSAAENSKKRAKGISTALDKLEGKAKVPARASGGRASYADMDAGAGGGKGRLEKSEIQKRN